jgi:RNA polymerase sigma-70 factor (ECF subfamily)
MTTLSLPETLPQAEFEAIMKNIRPELHRYVARMIGSAIDAEDVVQETLVKANASLSLLTSESNVRSWLFRIAHNKAIDYLRRYRDEPMELLDEYPSTEELDQPLEERELAAIALSVFLKLAPRQRSCVILKEVLDYSLVEISVLLNATVPEIKAALHRGRTRLRELAMTVEVNAPALDAHERALLARYMERFNARDFESLRNMLADEVQLNLFGRAQLQGTAEINSRYFYNYKEVGTCYLALGMVEGRLALLAYESSATQPDYFILISWDSAQITHIRDYRYARYVMQDAEVVPLK